VRGSWGWLARERFTPGVLLFCLLRVLVINLFFVLFLQSKQGFRSVPMSVLVVKEYYEKFAVGPDATTQDAQEIDNCAHGIER
jgi:hypothetical protein